MARLVRMDRTGHTTLAEWSAADDAAFAAAAPRSAEQLEAGYYAVVSEGEGQARQVTALPADADLVILRRPIAGGLSTGALPERAAVAWRRPVDARALRARERLWTLSTAAYSVPFVATAGILVGVEPWLAPVAALVARARLGDPGAARQPRREGRAPAPAAAARRAEATALGLLGDLVGHEARELHARTGLVMERGGLGVWLVGEAGALLVRPGGRRVHCWCVRVDDPSLPSADRTAHLLLALREDETGFATVANLAFSGATWRVRRRLAPAMRPALDAARRAARR